MGGEINYNSRQLAMLVVLSVMIGWHFLYEGLSKLVNPDSSPVAFLLDSSRKVHWDRVNEKII